VEKARKAKIQIKKKKPKPPVKPAKREDKSPERPAKPVVANQPKKEPTPREDPPKSPGRPDPKPEPKPEPPKHENSDLGTSRCNCPSCQAYEEFISASLPNFNQGPASGNPGPSSRRRSEGVLQARSVPSDSVRGSPGPMAQREAMHSFVGGGGGGGGDDAREGSTPGDSRRSVPSATSSLGAVSRSSNSGGSHRKG
jgi:hypothetical protein